MEDIIGKKFGKWEVIKFSHKDEKGNKYYVCKCECGKVKTQRYTDINTGRTKSCNSCANRKISAKDLSGKKFNRLTVIERVENKGTKVMWKCICDCGEIVFKSTAQLNKIKLEKDRCFHSNTKKLKDNEFKIINDYVIGKDENNNEFYFDLKYLDLVKKRYWHVAQDYAISNKTLLHRYLFGDECEGKLVDHVDGNTIDNRMSNLRLCETKENARNKHNQSNNTSGVIGVSKVKRNGKWLAYITVDYKKIRLGEFINFDDAVKARKQAESKYFGEFAPKNN